MIGPADIVRRIGSGVVDGRGRDRAGPPRIPRPTRACRDRPTATSSTWLRSVDVWRSSTGPDPCFVDEDHRGHSLFPAFAGPQPGASARQPSELGSRPSRSGRAGGQPRGLVGQQGSYLRAPCPCFGLPPEGRRPPIRPPPCGSAITSTSEGPAIMSVADSGRKPAAGGFRHEGVRERTILKTGAIVSGAKGPARPPPAATGRCGIDFRESGGPMRRPAPAWLTRRAGSAHPSPGANAPATLTPSQAPRSSAPRRDRRLEPARRHKSPTALDGGPSACLVGLTHKEIVPGRVVGRLLLSVMGG